MMDQPKRGRPPKKGKPTWKQAQMLGVINKKPGFAYRWINNDPQNIERKISEGWVFVNKDTGIPGEHSSPDNTGDGKPLDGAKTYREMVLMALPNELAEARQEWVKERTETQTQGLKRLLTKDVENAARSSGSPVAPVDGKIVIE